MIDGKDKKKKFEGLDKTFGEIEKQHGKGSIMFGNSKRTAPIHCSSGLMELDNVFGIGGIPSGRMIEIYGPESSGKTTLMLWLAGQVQKSGGIAGFVDAEHALDPVWATRMGVNMDELIISQPDSGEEALEITESLVSSNFVDFVIVDSVAALVPKAEINGEMGDSHMALQARLMSQAMRKLTPKVANSSCTVAFINQIRMKIGVMFGSPETTTGGNALKFYASIRLDVRRVHGESTIDDKLGQIAAFMRVKAVKNKVGSPFKKCELILHTNEETNHYGFDPLDGVFNLAVDNNIIKKAGTWYSYGEERLGQGKDNAKIFIRSNENIKNEIEEKVKQLLSEKVIYDAPIEGSLKDMQNQQSQEIVKEAEKVAEKKKVKEEKLKIEEPKRRSRSKKEEPETEEMNIIEEKENVKGDSNEKEETKKED